MSQLSIIRFGSAPEIEGENMPPPPDRPTGSQGICLAAVTDRTYFCPQHTEIISSNSSPEHLPNNDDGPWFIFFSKLIMLLRFRMFCAREITG
jgi:hypothetical protein